MDRRHFILSTAAAGCATAWAQSPRPPAIVVVGDSLSAEYGLARGSGWVALLQKKLRQEGRPERVVNASISGDTTAGGRARLPALLRQHQPAVVVIELGGNDALRGLPLESTAANLSWMTEAAQQAGARVLLVGMQVPPNYGADYTRRFANVFADVARKYRTALVPFLLQGVADGDDPRAPFQADGIHPKAEAHPRMLGNVWPVLKGLLK
ncbi:arylesterase [Xylophilus sp.]|uniref:arylesterase n=1 Tax=Xylophilus sp. TaxID=2653893 RepID=UPI002D80B174|nr:arylesterase [Xylophilus sp.]